jgi:hypothetical protein
VRWGEKREADGEERRESKTLSLTERDKGDGKMRYFGAKSK